MRDQEFFDAIDKHYDFTDGFIGNLREHHFRQDLADELTQLIRQYHLPENRKVDGRLIHELTYIPILAYWARPYLSPAEQSSLDDFIDEFFDLIYSTFAAVLE
ncbi:MAG: hypothetical protein Q4C87_10770 [Actinomycetaceae bacterium]|nr:hypothetical protein [Actinomycetaceae bacterium]